MTGQQLTRESIFLNQCVTRRFFRGMLLTVGIICLSYLEEGFVNELIQI